MPNRKLHTLKYKFKKHYLKNAGKFEKTSKFQYVARTKNKFQSISQYLGTLEQAEPTIKTKLFCIRQDSYLFFEEYLSKHLSVPRTIYQPSSSRFSSVFLPKYAKKWSSIIKRIYANAFPSLVTLLRTKRLLKLKKLSVICNDFGFKIQSIFFL